MNSFGSFGSFGEIIFLSHQMNSFGSFDILNDELSFSMSIVPSPKLNASIYIHKLKKI